MANVKQQRLVGRRSGPARAPDLAAQISALQRMHMLDQRHAAEYHEAEHQPLRRDPVRDRAPQQRFDVLHV